jgi:hypothetical protein
MSTQQPKKLSVSMSFKKNIGNDGLSKKVSNDELPIHFFSSLLSLLISNQKSSNLTRPTLTQHYSLTFNSIDKLVEYIVYLPHVNEEWLLFVSLIQIAVVVTWALIGDKIYDRRDCKDLIYENLQYNSVLIYNNKKTFSIHFLSIFVIKY